MAIFDEAQRAWNEESLTDFMKRKKGVDAFNQSEPEFLIRIMDRHQDWAVIVWLEAVRKYIMAKQELLIGSELCRRNLEIGIFIFQTR